MSISFPMIVPVRPHHSPLAVVRRDTSLWVPLPGPYPHEKYGRWDIDCEITFRKKEEKEHYRRLAEIAVFVPDYNFKTQRHVIESHAERLWLPFDSAGVSLGHELGTTPGIGGVRDVQFCCDHKAIKMSIYPPDEALWIMVDAFGSVYSRLRFLKELKAE
jgi:hypothetical protein